MAGITQKRALKALFPLWSLKKRKLGFIEKVKKKKTSSKTTFVQNLFFDEEYLTFGMVNAFELY